MQLDVHIANAGNRTNLLISEQSRDIARDSKLDSSAMKAIAVLTMVFLPGTFFAVRLWHVRSLLPFVGNRPLVTLRNAPFRLGSLHHPTRHEISILDILGRRDPIHDSRPCLLEDPVQV